MHRGQAKKHESLLSLVVLAVEAGPGFEYARDPQPPASPARGAQRNPTQGPPRVE